MQAKFAIGEIISHKMFGYRGVVIDIDFQFSADEAWYERVALSRPPKDQPWYHVLVDNAQHQTYVAERNLQSCDDVSPILHPSLGRYFSELIDGRYGVPKGKTN